MKPIIGLTSQYNQLVDKKMTEINNTYVNAVERAGAIPVIIPILENLDNIDKYIGLIDGLIITGGVDISPLRYGENPLKDTNDLCVERDEMEFKLLEEAIAKSIPILGICRGLQLINTALGGTLYQDIPSQLPTAHGHVSLSTMRYGYHQIQLAKDGYLYEIFKKDRIVVNSLHHQSIKEIGKGLKIVAKSEDDVIEAIEGTDDKRIYGVQFHPEALIDNHEEFIHVFKYFIDKL